LHGENTTLPSRFFHSSSCRPTLDSLRRFPTTPCWVAADGVEWAGGEQRRVGHTHGKARSGAGGEGEVSSWLCTPMKTTSTKDSSNQWLLWSGGCSQEEGRGQRHQLLWSSGCSLPLCPQLYQPRGRTRLMQHQRPSPALGQKQRSPRTNRGQCSAS
jgi:hypothetical protein